MRVRSDEKADALYVRLAESRVSVSEEIRPGVVRDLDERGEVAGTEILRVGKRLSTGQLKRVEFDLV